MLHHVALLVHVGINFQYLLPFFLLLLSQDLRLYLVTNFLSLNYKLRLLFIYEVIQFFSEPDSEHHEINWKSSTDFGLWINLYEHVQVCHHSSCHSKSLNLSYEFLQAFHCY